MDENNIFNNENNNFEKESNPPIDNFSNFSNNDTNFEENEIELDPELNPINTNYDNSYQYINDVTSNVYNNPKQVEPIAPIMPTIEKNEYKAVEQSSSGKGIKVFAIIMAFIIAISVCATGGYYLGKKSSNQQIINKQPAVDLASKPAPENALTVSQVYQNVSPSVVGIYVYNTEIGIAATATGVIYSEDGYIITNDHIYDGVAAAKFKIYTHDKKMYSADYVAGDTRSDLAVLKITDANNNKFIPAKFGNSDEAAVGECVVAIGRPNGATSPSIASEGIISVVSTRVSTTSSYTSSLIQTDSAINPGNSGGALCNIYGQVIGITSAKLIGNEYDGVGYAIPTTTVKRVVDSLIKHKTVKGRAKLGISYQHIDELASELLKLPCGLQIATIDKSCGLYGKSVEINDIITHINGTEITDSNIILDIIDIASPNDVLDLKIYSVKNKKSTNIKVKLLEDVGSSSYTNKKQETNNSNNKDKDKQEYNSSEFNFFNGD